ncbi:MAG: glycoside hydrolase family 9 protein [Ruminococcus sp.]|nr:glycoside hydrolase family 9 protein [Ruminococcus sp.]
MKNMNKKGLMKALTGSLMAAAMAAAPVTGAMVPVGANAGELLGATDFEDGVGIPWHTCSSASARQDFEIEDGAYTVRILNNLGGSGRWDLQFRHRGLYIVEGHKYHIHAEITPSEDGCVYTCIGNYANTAEYWNDTGSGDWQPIKLTKGETYIIDTDFVAGTGPSRVESGPAQWVFMYASDKGAESEELGLTGTGMPNGSTLTFDNMSLTDEDYTPDIIGQEYGVIRPKSNVRLNQVGYFTGLKKKASYTTDAPTPLEFDVYDGLGTSVYHGMSTVISGDYDSGTPENTTSRTSGGKAVTKYKDSGKFVHILDFTDLREAGDEYFIVVRDSTGVSGTRYGIQEKAFDTEVSGDKVVWTNPKTLKEYRMNKSHTFRISDNIYDGLLRDSMSYFYQNRSGVTIKSEYIKNANAASLAQPQAGHDPDTAYVQPKWVKYYTDKFDGDKDYEITASNGWYEAADHSKCVVSGGISVWTLQNMYEMSKHLGADEKWADSESMLIPQDENNAEGSPDVLDEARVELQWIFDMMVKSDDPYFGEDKGMVYHKMQDHKWTGLAIHAWAYEGYKDVTRIVKPPSYAATFNMVACAAQAARLWEGIDDDFAKKCLENAQIGLAAAEKHKAEWYDKNGRSAEQDDTLGVNSRGDDVYFAPLDQAIGGEPYGDTYVTDEYYWALCELFATTGDKEYYDKLRVYKNSNDATAMDKAFGMTTNLSGGENNGSFSSFNRGCTAGLGTLSLYLNSEQLNEEEAAAVKASICKAADSYLKQEEISGMGIPYVGVTFADETSIGIGEPIDFSGYERGSNSFVVNNAIVMAYAYDAAKAPKYLSGAATAMDYIFGRNGNDFSYVSGYGDTESGSVMQYPHHRLWANGIDPSFPKAPSGVLCGGPNDAVNDEYIRGVGLKRGALASQKCYVDSGEAWSVNEVALNWNAPLAWITSYLEDVAPEVSDVSDAPVVTTTAATSTLTAIETSTTTVWGSTPSAASWGDANLDGKITIADATAILQSIANKDKYELKPQGRANADIVDNGDGVTSKDALAIQMLDAKVISAEDLPITSDKL